MIASYVYDAWGNTTVLSADGSETTNETFIGNINPIRYRSYYYDTETKLFYTPGRYYDPEVGRFINADDIAYLDPKTLGGLNLYAYCLNNPISYIDPDGHAPKWWQWLLTGIAVVAAVAIGVIATVFTGGLAGAIIAGAAFGFAIGTTGSIVSQVATSGWEQVSLGKA